MMIGDEQEKERVSSRSILIFIASFLIAVLIYLEFNPDKTSPAVFQETRIVEGVEVVLPVERPAATHERVLDLVTEYVPVLENRDPVPVLEDERFMRISPILRAVAEYLELEEEDVDPFVSQWITARPYTLQGNDYGLAMGARRVTTHEGHNVNLRQIGILPFKEGGVARVVLANNILLASSDGNLVRLDEKGNPVTIITDDAYRGAQSWIGNDFSFGEEVGLFYIPEPRERSAAIIATLNAKTWFWIGGRLQHLGVESSQWYPTRDPIVLNRPVDIPEEGLWPELIKDATAHEPIGMMAQNILVVRASGPAEKYGLWTVNVISGDVTLLETWSTRVSVLD